MSQRKSNLAPGSKARDRVDSTTKKAWPPQAPGEWAEGKGEMKPFLYPTLELPDDTPIEDVRFSTRIRKALKADGIKTIGQVREAPDGMLLSFQNLGPGSVAYLRKTLGLPSTDGVRPSGKKPA
jgi:DNA-directed RNA polymerase alpha subunit